MILSFPERLLDQVRSIAVNNRRYIAFNFVWSSLIYGLYHYAGLSDLLIPTTAIALLGSALAIFLGFRNNSAYDRWWEARKIWGGIVNVSRTFAAKFLAVTEALDSESRRRIVYRHLAFINALRIQLRERDEWDELDGYLDDPERQALSTARNRATQLAATQAKSLTLLKRDGTLDAFEHRMLLELIERLYDLQGMAERIKKTVFPAFYDYFTRLFLYVFITTMPAGLVKDMDWHAIPLCVAISFVFGILEKTGRVTERPLDARSSGTPMNAICRTIEIDLRQMLGETELPAPYEVKTTRHGSPFLD
jgi:putative membrane protein